MHAEKLADLFGEKNMQVQDDTFRFRSGQKAFFGRGLVVPVALGLWVAQ